MWGFFYTKDYDIFIIILILKEFEDIIMAKNYQEYEKHLTFEEQIDLLIDRGMYVEDRKKAANILQDIGYYKLKEFTYPFATLSETNDKILKMKYRNISFNEVVFRYNQDKTFRLSLLHFIEDIEVSIKTQIAHTLSSRYGAMGYLNFSSWSNRNLYNKKTIKLIEKQFKYTLYNSVKRVRKSEFEHYKIDGDFPTVWVMVDIVSFGEVIKLLDCMSTSNLKEIANHYACTKNELVAWMNLVKIVRNICAHNKNGIDFKIKTMPMVREEWKDFIFLFKDNSPTNRIALVICIVIYLAHEINPDSSFDSICSPIEKLINNSDHIARRYGFKNAQSISEFQVFIQDLRR